jgi:NAD(P)-dependent dehydrogenase (short-subunit alcohol dehydrogenase family)
MKVQDLFSVRGKVALITGGSRGLGEMIARAYVENGAKVYITARKADACHALAQELSKIGECIAIPADLSNMDEIERLASELERRETRLDILVNNAGASWGANFKDFPESGWDKVMDLNVKSVFFLTQRLLTLLEAAASPDFYTRVINIGSIEGIRTSHLETYSYAASKAGVNHLTRMMAKFLAPKFIAVNGIAPGYFPSKMTAGIPEADAREVLTGTPMKRMGNADDMAGIALYLASRASAFVCGAVIPVGWGLGHHVVKIGALEVWISVNGRVDWHALVVSNRPIRPKFTPLGQWPTEFMVLKYLKGQICAMQYYIAMQHNGCMIVVAPGPMDGASP